MKNVVFLIGNSAYQYLDKLSGPVQDVKVVGAEFKRLGFEVISYVDMTSQKLYEIAYKYRKECNYPGIKIFYYAGHGFHIDNINYIIGIDAALDDNFTYNALDLSEISAIRNKHCDAVCIVFSDACRNLPTNRKTTLYRTSGNLSIKKGFSESQFSDNTLLVFSTLFGETAKDLIPKLQLSPFAAALASALSQWHRSIFEILAEVQRKVVSITGGQQVPTYLSSLGTSLFLKEGNFPKKRLDIGRRLYSELNFCASDPDIYRASFYSAKGKIWCDYPNKLAMFPKHPHKSLKRETIDRFSISFNTPNGQTVTSLACAGYFFVAGTDRGSILFQCAGELLGCEIHSSEIWSIDILVGLDKVVFSSDAGAFLVSIKVNKGKFRYFLRTLTKVNSYCSSFGTFDNAVCVAETDMYNNTKIIMKYFTERSNVTSIRLKNPCHCYAVMPIKKFNIVVCATDKGLYFWELDSPRSKNGFRQEDTSYTCLAVGRGEQYLATATSHGVVEYWDVEKKLRLDESRVCASDVTINSLSWTNTGCIIASLSNGTLVQLYNCTPEMHSDEWYEKNSFSYE